MTVAIYGSPSSLPSQECKIVVSFIIYSLYTLNLHCYQLAWLSIDQLAINKQMKALKVKFQNKKKKPNYKNLPKQVSSHEKEQSHIGFLLRENTDAQKAKNELRKASQQVYEEPEDSDNKFTWGNTNVEMPFSWLDQMPKCEVKEIVKTKLGQNSQAQLISENRYGKAKCFSNSQSRVQNQINLLSGYEILHKNLFSKKGSFSALRTQKSEQKCENRNSMQNLQPNRKKSKMKEFSSMEQELQQCEKQRKLVSKNLSAVAIKHRSRLALITPKMNDHSQTETSRRVKNMQGVSTIYFRVPDFSKHLKRAVTVHCEANSRESLVPGKNHFYLKKTNTICVAQKQTQQANRCISLCNYKSMNLSRKASRIPTDELQQGEKESGQASINRLSMEKAAKTVMLKQEFERLRKLLKKEAVAEFKMDDDCPIKITRL